MKIIRKDRTPNGTEIQLEAWERGLTIGAYPIAVNSGKYGFVRANEAFRLHIQANEYKNYTDEDVMADFQKLVTGEKTLQDLSEHFWNGEKDNWYLGMFAPGSDEWYEAYSKYAHW